MNASSQNSQIDFWSASGIVAQREITVRLRSKSFIISTIIMLIFIVAAVVLMPRIGDLFGGPGSLAVTPETKRSKGTNSWRWRMRPQPAKPSQTVRPTTRS